MSIKIRKCNKCGQKKSNFSIHKKKVICDDCLEGYLESSTTCSVCGIKLKRKNEYIEEEFSDSDKNKTFCSKTCYNKVKQEKLDLDELDLWLKNYHKVETLNSRIYMQINQYIKKNNFTHKGILLTLQYLTNDLKKELQIDNISIVAWYYDQAKANYIKKIESQKKSLLLKEQNFQMFNNINTKSSVKREKDNRNEKILITKIDFE